MNDIRPAKQPSKFSPAQTPAQTVTAPVPSEVQPPKPPRKSHKKRWWILGISIFLVVAIAAAGIGSAWWYNDALQPRSAAHSRIRITIQSGATPAQIGQELEEKGAIKSSLAFRILADQSGNKGKLQAGNYLFSPTQSTREILNWLVQGKVDTLNVTILPGKTLIDIKESLLKDGFKAADIDAAFAKKYDHPLLASKPAEVNLDGYIYPETYQISSETTVEQLLLRSFDQLYKLIQDKNLQPQLSARGFNLHQAFTLASLAQLEVTNETERRQVAQVFERRLQIGMELGSDVTFLYAAQLTGQEPSVNLDSPYNTRRYKGLPPGAVSNFTISALQAVADPAPGDYLYFVAGDDGITRFARTFEEHNTNVQRYCTVLCR